MDVVASIPVPPTARDEARTALSRVHATAIVCARSGTKRSMAAWRRVASSARAVSELAELDLGSFDPMVGFDLTLARTCASMLARAGEHLHSHDSLVACLVSGHITLAARELGVIGSPEAR